MDGDLGRLHHLGLDLPRDRGCRRHPAADVRGGDAIPRRRLDHGRPRDLAWRLAADQPASPRLVRPDRRPASRGQRRPVPRGTGHPDGTRVADHRVGPSVRGAAARFGPRAAAGPRARRRRRRFHRCGGAPRAVARLVDARDRAVRRLGRDVVGRLVRRRPPDDAGRPVHRDDVGDARRRGAAAPVRPGGGRLGAPFDCVVPRLDLPRHDRLGGRLLRLHVAPPPCARSAPSRPMRT